MADPLPTEGRRPLRLPRSPLQDRERPTAPLPVPPTSFVGRTREIADVVALLRRDGVRLVTLTGAGGIGKTRLAIAAATEAAPGFDGGACFVTFAPITDLDLVGSAVALALGVRPAGARPLPAQLGAVLAATRRLVLLDNLEQVLDAAPLLAEILTACPGLTILATSREPLHLSAEHEYPVPALSLESRALSTRDSEAVALFAQRARAVLPGFAVTAENEAAVAALCARLDGLPLAIELAAARVKIFSPAALLARLDRPDGADFGLLTGGPRDAPPRHRTLRDAIAWSHDLLTPEEQAILRRLAVFAGGFTLDAAEAVTEGLGASRPSVLDAVVSLVDKSLLRPEEVGEQEPRFGMLETVRVFARERLAASGEDATVRDRHAEWCLDLSERVWTVMCGVAEEPRWLRRVATEHDNLRAALAWLERAGAGERMLRLVVALDRFWSLGGHRVEATTWFARALACGRGAPPHLRCQAMAGYGNHLERQGHHEQARALHEEVLALVRERGDWLEHAFALHALGVVALNQGRIDAATTSFDEALAIYRRLEIEGAQHWIFYCQGGADNWRGDFAEGIARIETSLAGHRALGDVAGIVCAINALAPLCCEQGHEARAAALLMEALPLWQHIGNHEGLAEWLDAVARLAVCRGRLVPAARLYGAAEAMYDAAGVPRVLPPPHHYRRVVDAVRTALGATAFVAAWAAGRALPIEQAVAEAVAATADPAAEAEPTAADLDPLGGALTRRQREVLRLVAEGRSDREIAEQLCLSYRTVTSHVRDILTKLDLPSRTAAATFAVRRGLA